MDSDAKLLAESLAVAKEYVRRYEADVKRFTTILNADPESEFAERQIKFFKKQIKIHKVNIANIKRKFGG